VREESNLPYQSSIVGFAKRGNLQSSFSSTYCTPLTLAYALRIQVLAPWLMWWQGLMMLKLYVLDGFVISS
jgi:hypothetical protein